MNAQEKEVFDSVQAALLNSECSPSKAVEIALQTVREFAEAESVKIPHEQCVTFLSSTCAYLRDGNKVTLDRDRKLQVEPQAILTVTSKS